MWWNDLKDIKEWMKHLSDRLEVIDEYIRGTSQDESDSLDRLHDKMTTLINDEARIGQADLATKTLDKFEDYMKNVDKLNAMINEFKGAVSLARASIAERKEQQKEFEDLKKVAEVSKKIHDSMRAFIDAGDELERKNYFKLDAIYRKVCEIEEEKPKKKGNSRKKTTSP